MLPLALLDPFEEGEKLPASLTVAAAVAELDAVEEALAVDDPVALAELLALSLGLLDPFTEEEALTAPLVDATAVAEALEDALGLPDSVLKADRLAEELTEPEEDPLAAAELLAEPDALEL